MITELLCFQKGNYLHNLVKPEIDRPILTYIDQRKGLFVTDVWTDGPILKYRKVSLLKTLLTLGYLAIEICSFKQNY